MNKKSKLFITVSSITLLLASCKGLPRFKPTTEPPTSGGDSDTSSVVSSGAVSSSGAVTSETSGEDSTSVTSVTGVTSGTAVTSGTPTSATTASTGTSSTKPSSSSTGTSATSHTSTGTSATSKPTSSSTGTSAPTSSGTSATSATSATSSTSGSSDYYAQCEGLEGSALQSKLLSINAPKSTSYDWSRYEDADEALDDSGSILSLYTRHNIAKGNHCGSYSWTTWNREHIWTQSAWPKSASDNHNIFACEGQINGYRGNKPFAEGGDTVVVFGHTTGCKQTSSTFEPCDDAKGEVARAVMYGTVMYSYTMTNEIKSIALALKWHIQHPSTERDIRRNEVVYVNQGNRNPFVDHPEYACRIWGNTNSETKSLCGLS